MRTVQQFEATSDEESGLGQSFSTDGVSMTHLIHESMIDLVHVATQYDWVNKPRDKEDLFRIVKAEALRLGRIVHERQGDA